MTDNHDEEGVSTPETAGSEPAAATPEATTARVEHPQQAEPAAEAAAPVAEPAAETAAPVAEPVTAVAEPVTPVAEAAAPILPRPVPVSSPVAAAVAAPAPAAPAPPTTMAAAHQSLPPIAAGAEPATAAPKRAITSATFGARVAAYAIDSALMLVVIALSIWLSHIHLYLSVNPDGGPAYDLEGPLWVPVVVGFIVSTFYFVLLESSQLQGTIGKLALGLAVTGADNRRLSIGGALRRQLAKYISVFTLAAYNRKGQALHDILAGTMVVNQGPLRTAEGDEELAQYDLAHLLRQARTSLMRRWRSRQKSASGLLFLRFLLLLLVGLFATGFFGFRYLYFTDVSSGTQLNYRTIDKLVNNRQVITATELVFNQQLTGTFCSQATVNGHCAGRVTAFYLPIAADTQFGQLEQSMVQNGVDLSVDHQVNKSVLWSVLQFFLPLAMLATVFGIIFVTRSGGGGGMGDIVGFGGIGKKKQKGIAAGVTFANVAGADEAVVELREVVEYLSDPDRYKLMGAQPPKGVLLFGPPGCGKTLLARAAAGEAGVPFFSISGAEFVESLVGVGAARVRDLFRQVRLVAPAIIFIDEIDAAGRKRSGEGGSGGEREQTLNQMLVEMDGFEVAAGIVVMGATNRPDILDPALLRPGRFDRHITVGQPDVHGREEILRLHARNKPLAADVDLQLVAKRTPGFTGADLANVINESALLAIRENASEIAFPHLAEAIQRVLSGPKRRGHLISAEERKRVAFHEAGHALVAAALGRLHEVHRVSVVARGRGIGQSIVSTDADKGLLTRSAIIDRMTIALGGIAAEETRFGERSTSSENDIELVSDLSREMVGRYGMSDKMGLVRLVGKDVDGFLGGSTGLVAVSGDTLRDFDVEVRQLIEGVHQRSIDIIAQHREHLERFARTLEEVETLEGAELEVLLAGVRPEVNLLGSGPARNGNGRKQEPSLV